MAPTTKVREEKEVLDLLIYRAGISNHRKPPVPTAALSELPPVRKPRWRPGTYGIRLGTFHLAVADVCELGEMAIIENLLEDVMPLDWYITRINVPKDYRGQGHATRLLKAVLEDAQFYRQTVVLDINESDGLNYDQLKAWYERHGFTELVSTKGLMIWRCSP